MVEGKVEDEITFLHRVQFGLARCALWTFRWLPQSFGYSFVGMLGRLYFLLVRRRRAIALANLRLAYPDKSQKELRRIGSRAAANSFKLPIDMELTTALIERGRPISDVVDLGDLAKDLPEGPMLATSGHLGSWEVAAIVFCGVGREGHGIARKISNPLVQRFLVDNRRRAGLFLHGRRGGVRGMLAAVKRGCIGLMLPDQNQRQRPIFVPFFGKLAATDRTSATIALRIGCPVLVGACLRIGNGFRFKMHYEIFHPKSTDDLEADIHAATANMNERLEGYIRMAPDQYLWLHNRFRTRPTDETQPTKTGTS